MEKIPVHVGLVVIGQVPDLPPGVLDRIMDHACRLMAEDEGGESAEGRLGIAGGLLLSGVDGGEEMLRADYYIKIMTEAMGRAPETDDERAGAVDMIMRALDAQPEMIVSPALTTAYCETRAWFARRGLVWRDLGRDWLRLIEGADHIVVLMPADAGDPPELQAMVREAQRRGRSLICALLPPSNAVRVFPSRAAAQRRVGDDAAAAGEDRERKRRRPPPT